jgi:hypothetical protein
MNIIETVSNTYEVGQSILITDLYDVHELTDESERIGHCAPPICWDEPLIVKTMSAPEAKIMVKTLADSTLWDAYNKDASRKQKSIVAKKVKSFDPTRVVVLDNNIIVDGNHQVIAAIMCNEPILYVDLGEWG